MTRLLPPETPMPKQPEQALSERETQNRVIVLFRDLARADGPGYRFLSDWHDRGNNRALKQAMMQELLTGKMRLVAQDNTEGKP